MSDVLVDVTEIYERAKEAARAAVAGAPGCDYGLEDVMPEESWLIVTASRSQFMSLVPVYATLDGCVEAGGAGRGREEPAVGAKGRQVIHGPSLSVPQVVRADRR